MIQTSLSSILRVGLVLSALALSAVRPVSLPAQEREAPQIKIVVVPPKKPGNPVDVYRISGSVSGVRQTKDYAVVIYAFAGDQWWVQPFDYQPKTAIRNGKFETVTHGGSVYAALLVRSGYMPETPIQALPSVDVDVVAIDSVAGKPNE
jgi:hypothetical protein